MRLLSTNSNNVKRAEAQTYKNIPPRLRNHAQAFRTAGKKFQVIAEQTTDILVPYGDGNDLISDLNGELYGNEYLKLILKRCQIIFKIALHNFRMQ